MSARLRTASPMCRAFLRPRSVAVIGASDQPGNIGGAAVRFFASSSRPASSIPSIPAAKPWRGPSGLRERRRASVAARPCDPRASRRGRRRRGTRVRRRRNQGGNRLGGRLRRGRRGRPARQNELVAICRETGFSLLGPNCLGVIETHAPITASFASMMLAARSSDCRAISRWSARAADWRRSLRLWRNGRATAFAT